MLTQTNFFAPAETADDGSTSVVLHPSGEPIAVQCGFRDRHNNPCDRLRNWPIMDAAKQMLCRDRPMIHCDVACFRGAPPAPAPAPAHGVTGGDVIWGEEGTEYGGVQ